VSATAGIRSAITTTLASVTTSNGYSTNVVEVGSEPKGIDEVRSPAVYLLSMDGQSDLESLSNLQGQCKQAFRMQLVIRSATPQADMDAFLDDVRNAVEKSTSALLSLSYVVRVTVSGWSPTFTESHINDGVYLRECDVVVDYVYQRGSV
jgi:hypothetical protein